MKFIFKYLLPLILIIGAVIGYFGYAEYQHFQAQTVSRDIASFEIKKGSSIRTVAKQLEQKGIIKRALFFTILAKLNKQDTKIKAGEYALKSGMNPKQILDKFTKGSTLQYQTQILEGKLFTDIIKTIQADPNLKQTLTSDDYKNIMAKLKTKDKAYQQFKPEGLFLPDTYSSPRHSTDLEFLQRSHDALIKLVDKHWQTRTPFKGINTPYDAIILASAGLKRLGFNERITETISTEQSLPAIGQGAIGIECRADDERINALLAPLNHPETALRLQAERAQNTRLNGGCQIPIGGYAELIGDKILLRGLIGFPDGSKIFRAEKEGDHKDAEAIGIAVAEDLLAQGGGKVLEQLGIEL